MHVWQIYLLHYIEEINYYKQIGRNINSIIKAFSNFRWDSLYTYIHAFKINIMHDDKTILLSNEMKKKAKRVK